MKKSNYLVLAVSALVSVFLLYIWYAYGFNKIDNPLDLVISIIWWLLIVALVVLINRWEAKRQRAIRTVYLAPAALYNSEVGVRQLDATPADAAEAVLRGLEYGFGTKDAPARDKFDYRYVVKTETYKPAASGSSNAEPTWQGSLVTIDRVNGNTEKSFSSKKELVALLA